MTAPLDLSQPYIFTQLVAKFKSLNAGLQRLDHAKTFFQCVLRKIVDLVDRLVDSVLWLCYLRGRSAQGGPLRGGWGGCIESTGMGQSSAACVEFQFHVLCNERAL